MRRIAITFSALVLFTSVASAQPRQLPLSPGVMPGSPWGPGAPFAPTTPLPPGQPTVPPARYHQHTFGGFGSYGFDYDYPAYNNYNRLFSYGYGYGYGGPLSYTPYFPPQLTVVESAPAQSEPLAVAANEFPARLTLQLPTAGDVWLDGKKVSTEANDEQVLTSPVLRPNQQYTFNVKARWSHKGKTYEAKRSVTMNPGDRSRLMIVSGDEVRE